MTVDAANLSIEPAGHAPKVIELVLRPDHLLRDDRILSERWALVLLVAVLGVGAGIDNIALLGYGALEGRFPNWSRYWMFVLVGALIRGPIRYLLGGWWFRVRLRMCGVREVAPRRTRRISALTDLVSMVPAILVTLGQTLVSPTPASAGAGAAWPDLLVGYFTLWSLLANYLVATGCFPVRKGRAVFWFAVLPGVLTAGLVGWAIIRQLQ